MVAAINEKFGTPAEINIDELNYDNMERMRAITLARIVAHIYNTELDESKTCSPEFFVYENGATIGKGVNMNGERDDNAFFHYAHDREATRYFSIMIMELKNE